MATPVTTRVPLDIGAIHFIGIGGIGMSGIAEIMHNLGYKVQGSDAAENANVKRLRATVAVVTNADPDHLDFYGTFENMRDAFQRFVENVPFYGFAVLCIDHPEVQAMVGRITDRRIITYGFSPQADARAVNVRFSEGASHFDCVFTDRRKGTETRLDDMSLPMPGEHNVQNAMAAIVVARQLGVPDAVI